MEYAADVALTLDGSNWLLDDLAENIDIQEDNEKVTQIRQHFTIQIHTQIKCSDVPAVGHIGKTTAVVPYSVGSLKAKKNAPAGCSFLCVADGITPLEHPGDYCVRKLVLESFGKFFLAPLKWNK